ncbi:MAG: hypothetical protein ACXVIG_04125 [Halobacteriota archaeon]
MMHHRKVTAALAIAALMTLAVVTAGCTTTTSPSPTPTPVVQTTAKAGNNTTLTSTAGFKITFPSKYKYDQNGSTPVKVYIYLDPANPVTGVNVGTETLTQGATLDSLSNFYTNQLLNYQNVSYRQALNNTTLGGQPAKTLTFQAIVPVQYNQTTTTNQTIIVQEAWTISNGTAFTVTYKAPPNDFSKFAPEAQKIISSFQLT